MITIILENKNENELGRTSELSNVEYLIQDNEREYVYLSRLSEVDYDVFSKNEIPGLIYELVRVRENLISPNQIEHLNQIIELAKKCWDADGDAILIFTPWGNERIKQ